MAFLLCKTVRSGDLSWRRGFERSGMIGPLLIACGEPIRVGDCVAITPLSEVTRRIHAVVQYPDYGDPVIGLSEIDQVPLNAPPAIASPDMLTTWRCLR